MFRSVSSFGPGLNARRVFHPAARPRPSLIVSTLSTPESPTLLFESNLSDDDFGIYSDKYDDDSYRRRRKRAKVLVDEDVYDDDDDDDYDEDGFFNREERIDGVIPNALLDNIDPDGALSRMDELLTNGKFWRDICLMLLALNFLDNLLWYDESPWDYFVGTDYIP